MSGPLRRVGIGTAQIGMPYGVTNTAGVPSSAKAKKILIRARRRGIHVFDTAPCYGDGQAEQRLGAFLPADCSRVVTKIPPLPSDMEKRGITDFARNSLENSLQRLGRKSVYGLLGHCAKDFINPESSGGLIDAMCRLRDEGKVEKIGVSVYEADEIDAIMKVFSMDLIQLPLSVFDQRLLLRGHLSYLHENNVEIHARSVFLQGLLLACANNFPASMEKRKHLFSEYHEFLGREKMNPLHVALSFVLGISEVGCAIIGVTSADEIDDVVDACCEAPVDSSVLRRFAVNDPLLLNPARWEGA